MELKAAFSIDSGLWPTCTLGLAVACCGDGIRLQGTQIKQARPIVSGQVQRESAPAPVVSGEDLAAGRSFHPVAGNTGTCLRFRSEIRMVLSWQEQNLGFIKTFEEQLEWESYLGSRDSKEQKSIGECTQVTCH